MCIGIPEGKERENGAEEIFEVIMAGNFPKLMTNSKSQIQEAQRTSINTKNLHLGISYSSYKKKKGQRENKETRAGWWWEESYLLRNKIRIVADFRNHASKKRME